MTLSRRPKGLKIGQIVAIDWRDIVQYRCIKSSAFTDPTFAKHIVSKDVMSTTYGRVVVITDKNVVIATHFDPESGPDSDAYVIPYGVIDAIWLLSKKRL